MRSATRRPFPAPAGCGPGRAELRWVRLPTAGPTGRTIDTDPEFLPGPNVGQRYYTSPDGGLVAEIVSSRRPQEAMSISNSRQ